MDHGGRVGRAKRIARQIRDARPLTVSLRIDGERGLAELPAIVNEFRKWDTCLEATIRLRPGAGRALRWRYPIGVIWAVDGARPFSIELPDEARAVAFTPDGENIALLPEVLREFSGSGAEVLHLPNVNAVRAIADRGHVPLASAAQFTALAAELGRAPAALAGKRLVVHDYFLWRTLRAAFPDATGDRVEFSGCQAGTAVAYVDWEGTVYPCESLPVRLGSLVASSFEQIWASPARRSVAETLRSAPRSCDGCGTAAECLGGCRGMAYVAAGTVEAPDPACPGPEPAGVPKTDA